MIEAGFALVTGIVSLRRKHEVICILRVTKKRLYTFQCAPGIEFEALLTDRQFFTLKGRAPAQILVDEPIQLLDRVI
jgi:hypothetical protein